MRFSGKAKIFRVMYGSFSSHEQLDFRYAVLFWLLAVLRGDGLAWLPPTSLRHCLRTLPKSLRQLLHIYVGSFRALLGKRRWQEEKKYFFNLYFVRSHRGWVFYCRFVMQFLLAAPLAGLQYAYDAGVVFLEALLSTVGLCLFTFFCSLNQCVFALSSQQFFWRKVSFSALVHAYPSLSVQERFFFLPLWGFLALRWVFRVLFYAVVCVWILSMGLVLGIPRMALQCVEKMCQYLFFPERAVGCLFRFLNQKSLKFTRYVLKTQMGIAFLLAGGLGVYLGLKVGIVVVLPPAFALFNTTVSVGIVTVLSGLTFYALTVLMCHTLPTWIAHMRQVLSVFKGSQKAACVLSLPASVLCFQECWYTLFALPGHRLCTCAVLGQYSKLKVRYINSLAPVKLPPSWDDDLEDIYQDDTGTQTDVDHATCI